MEQVKRSKPTKISKLSRGICKLQTGASFRSTNIPEDHVDVDWTMEDMIAEEGEKVSADFCQVKY
jgi:hypothetical protein